METYVIHHRACASCRTLTRMLVSSDRILRVMGSHNQQLPRDKEELTDTAFHSIHRKIGYHQTFLDIARGYQLTSSSFAMLGECCNLMYLDISFTKIDDISDIATNCLNLRGLNLAGLQLVDSRYTGLRSFLNMEVLSLRLSNISYLDSLEDLVCIRSLDLGCTKFESLKPIAPLRRLEELVLDYSTIMHGSLPSFHFKELKLLNPYKSSEQKSLQQLLDEVDGVDGSHLIVETLCRRYVYHNEQSFIKPYIHYKG